MGTEKPPFLLLTNHEKTILSRVLLVKERTDIICYYFVRKIVFKVSKFCFAACIVVGYFFVQGAQIADDRKKILLRITMIAHDIINNTKYNEPERYNIVRSILQCCDLFFENVSVHKKAYINTFLKNRSTKVYTAITRKRFAYCQRNLKRKGVFLQDALHYYILLTNYCFNILSVYNVNPFSSTRL